MANEAQPGAPNPQLTLQQFYLKFKLSDTVLVAFMTSTTTTVLGLYGIAAYWMYGKGKPKDDKAETESEKRPSKPNKSAAKPASGDDADD